MTSMQTSSLRTVTRDGVRTRARHELMESRLRRFRPELARHVMLLARRHLRLADLALSFPALLAALASPRSGFDPESTILRVIEGASLEQVASCASVPMWLRRLPPESLPMAIPELPDGMQFRREIGNYIPRLPKHVPAWLDGVAKAASWANDGFALWLARELRGKPTSNTISRLPLLSLWAWFSLRPETRAHSLLELPWVPSVRFAKAMEAAQEWRAEVRLHLNLAGQPIDDVWLVPAIVDGYEFVPLRSSHEIAEEAKALRNCLRDYGYDLAHNRSRLWSVRRNGTRVAALEIALRGRDPLIEIYELKGPANKVAGREVWWAAYRWLHAHDLPRLDTRPLKWDAVSLDRATWIALWRPYWIAKRRIPKWLPLTPSRDAIDAL
jgi:hypothetical protein